MYKKTNPTVHVFRYIPQLDAFLPSAEYKKVADRLGLTEWNPVVFIGRYFYGDRDAGEHWFDNWKGREKIAKKAKKLGYDPHNLLVIDPKWFAYNPPDQDRHPSRLRKQFWTDVLMHMRLSLDFLFEEARHINNQEKKGEFIVNRPIKDLEKRIKQLEKEFSVT